MASDANDAQAQNTANADATQREASEYWDYLIKPDKCGTELFDRLLKGIADVISKNFDPGDSPDLTPSQLAAFYRAVGGNYDVLFVETPPTSISFIYRSLGAFHSLQPAPDDDGYSSPTIPALKKKGFVTWQTIQILLGPEEHVPFLQNAVAQFDVVDPETGSIFPKVLPKECLPDRPDDAMEAWYEGVASRLKREAEEDAAEKERGPRVRVEVDDHGPRTSSELSDDADERHAAAKYFADPLYRKSRIRPPFVRHFSKENRPYENDRDRGRLISSVRHMLNPFNRRKSMQGRYEDEDYSDNDATPVAPVPPPAPAPRYPTHKRPHPPRRESTPTDSDSDSDRPPSRRRTPDLRHRRSHDPPPSSHEYFPAYVDGRDRRYSHDVPPAGRKEDGPPPVYGPTKSPLFATHVAQIQAHNYYDRRPQLAQRTSYRPQSHVRYAAQLPDDRSDRLSPPYARDRDRDRDYDRDRDRDRDRDAYELPAGGGRHRRKSEDYPREKDRNDSARASRSHERVRDEWDDRDSRSGDRDRDGARRTHRYVSGVQDGVGGRRYPVAESWQR